MEEIIKEAFKRGASPDGESVIYRGLKFMSNGTVLKTTSDFYQPLDKKYLDIFVSKGFETGVNRYLIDKYKNGLNRIESMINDEINGDKNHKRMKNLKGLREELIIKYNELIKNSEL